MRLGTCARLVCASLLFATPALAQATTDDGIRALLGGDYSTAARILRPLADDVAKPDPVAQFFLAVLYETGQGVKPDMARACGLFLRSASREHPFTEQSAALARNMVQQLGDGASMLCVANETWQGGPPQTIVFGPGHHITFTDTSVVLVDGDHETRTLWKWPPEAVMLPIQYTPVDVTRPLSTRRRFLQLFQWIPDESRNPSSWTLTWGLLEVVGDQWLMPAWEKDVALAHGPGRPDARDLGRFVRLRTNGNGEAEFTILSGPRARTEAIPWKAGQ